MLKKSPSLLRVVICVYGDAVCRASCHVIGLFALDYSIRHELIVANGKCHLQLQCRFMGYGKFHGTL